MTSVWYRMIDWFSEAKERINVVRDFNRAAKYSFLSGEAQTLLQARITRGSSAYRHEFSKFMQGGFRIKALSGRPLHRHELISIGIIVIDNEMLVRKLISLGWDTLEVHDSQGYDGCKWELKKHAKIGGYLNS